MKLKTLLENYFKSAGPTTLPNGIVDYILTPQHIEMFREELEKCDEFLGSIIAPIKEIESGRPKRVVQGHDDDGTPIMTIKSEVKTTDGEEIVTTKLKEGFKVDRVVRLHSISLTGEIITPDDMIAGSAGDIRITTTYDVKNLIPLTKMVITWSPEQIQDEAMKQFADVMEEKAKKEKKEEFTVDTSNQEDMGNAVDQALNMAANINREDFQKFAAETENKMVDEILTEAKQIMLGSIEDNEKYRVKGKKGIMIRLTKNSLLPSDDNSLVREEDGYVVV